MDEYLDMENDFLEEYTDGVMAIDSQYRIISFSESAERITGYSSEEVLGIPCHEVFKCDSPSDCPIKEVVEKGDIISNRRIDITTRDGERIPLCVYASPLRDSTGRIVGAISTFRNIDEVKRLTRELSYINREILIERNKLRAIMDSIADGVFTIDQNWRIVSFNKGAEQITGFSAQEAIGSLCHNIFQSDICQKGCPLQLTLQTGKSVSNFEVEILTEDNRRVPISVSTALLRDETGEVIGGVETFRDLSKVKQLTKELESRYSFDNIMGKSSKMQELYELLEDVCESEAVVLIQGESGTGKDLVARAIHYNSPRRDKPFIKVNCAALPEPLLESELFGHVKGAFTSAIKDKPGRFELADKGTIFLDEIGELSLAMQVKLLRVLEEQRFERVGGVKTIQVDVRIIAATNRNLPEAMAEGTFREDLYYRLDVVPLHLPPLRDRIDDIPLLAEHFIAKLNQKTGKRILSISPQAMELLLDYEWPGNVRQLENVIERAFVYCRGPMLSVEHLPKEIRGVERKLIDSALESDSPLEQVEKQTILRALEKNNWKRGDTANELKIDRTTLWRKMKKYQII